MISAPRTSLPSSSGLGGGQLAGVTFELQELWFSLMRREWRSLGFVPAHAGGRVATLTRKFASIGRMFRGTALTLVEATDLDLEGAARVTQQLQAGVWSAVGSQDARNPMQSEVRTIVALDPVVENPLSIPVALATNGVVLVIEQGVTTQASAERTIQLIGRDLVLGAIMIGR